MAQVPEIFGICDPRFNAVRTGFADNFAKGKEIGASVCITVDGKPVVDLWAGKADKDGKRPWHKNTIVNVYSTTKGLGAICANLLVERGAARSRCAGCEILAGVRAGRQSQTAGALLPDAPGRASRRQKAAQGGKTCTTGTRCARNSRRRNRGGRPERHTVITRSPMVGSLANSCAASRAAASAGSFAKKSSIRSRSMRSSAAAPNSMRASPT